MRRCFCVEFLVHPRVFRISSTADDNLTLFSSPVFISFRRTLPSLTSLGPKTRHIPAFNESAYSSCLLSGRCLRSEAALMFCLRGGWTTLTASFQTLSWPGTTHTCGRCWISGHRSFAFENALL